MRSLYTIRVAQIEDAPAMARVMVDTFLSAHRGQLPHEVWVKRCNEWGYDVSAAAWLKSLQEIATSEKPQQSIYVAVAPMVTPMFNLGTEEKASRITGEIIGVVMARLINENTAEVCVLYVREDHQRRGIGRSLLQAITAHLVQQGILSLIIAVLASNHPARCFYETLGGEVVEERAINECGVILPGVVYGWRDIQTLINIHTGHS